MSLTATEYKHTLYITNFLNSFWQILYTDEGAADL